jgi:hypothetical protein
VGALAACRPVDGLGSDVPLFDAELRALNLHGMTILGGAFGGQGRLELDTADGPLEVPVRVRGSNAGLGVELEVVSHGVLEASVPDGAVVDDVFGRYHGSNVHVGILYGVEIHHLKNDAGIEFHGPASVGSLALLWGAEWLTIDPITSSIPDPTVDTGGAR